jgi:hypothetical protein
MSLSYIYILSILLYLNLFFSSSPGFLIRLLSSNDVFTLAISNHLCTESRGAHMECNLRECFEECLTFVLNSCGVESWSLDCVNLWDLYASLICHFVCTERSKLRCNRAKENHALSRIVKTLTTRSKPTYSSPLWSHSRL